MLTHKMDASLYMSISVHFRRTFLTHLTTAVKRIDLPDLWQKFIYQEFIIKIFFLIITFFSRTDTYSIVILLTHIFHFEFIQREKKR